MQPNRTDRKSGDRPLATDDLARDASPPTPNAHGHTNRMEATLEQSSSPRHARRRTGRYKRLGVARVLSPVKQTTQGRWTGRWYARYIDLQGTRRQAGVHNTKGAARLVAEQEVHQLNARGRASEGLTLAQWNQTWPGLVGLQPRSEATHRHRMAKYVLPYVPEGARLEEIDRGTVLGVQDALLACGLAKRTIDNAIGSFSAVLGYALDRQIIQHNPAFRVRVKHEDQRLRPKRRSADRRFVPAEELAAFLASVPARHRAVCAAPALTGLRTQELFAVRGEEILIDEQLIWVYQRAPVTGGIPTSDLIPGTKTVRAVHNKPKDELGRFTLFPQELLAMIAPQDVRPIGLLFASPRGRVWAQRNFYRDVWRAGADGGPNFTLYDLRHTWVSVLSSAGIPDAEVSLYSGHAVHTNGALDNTMTRVYRHATGKWREVALRAVSAYWNDVTTAAGTLASA